MSAPGGARSILGHAPARAATSSTGATRKSGKENGASAFAVFKDGEGDAADAPEPGEWEDLGTVKSRKKENEREATAWKGETMPMANAGAAPRVRLEIFHDDVSGIADLIACENLLLT